MTQICTRCVMDASVPEIEFDSGGVCNFCTEFLSHDTSRTQGEVNDGNQLAAFFDQVKREGKGKQYDCIVGVSGGVDSSWVLYLAVQGGLRPLAVHMDNGWNSELAQQNIENLVNKLGVPLYTHVINWQEYKKFMQGFFDADVVDVELLYDNAMLAVNYRLAAKYNIRWILAGTNRATEGMRMPAGWNWLKFDRKNIIALGKRAGARLATFPALGVLGYVWFEYIRRIKWFSVLDLTSFSKADALNTLTEEVDYRPYPYKHYESIFTRFYQARLLPEKFGVDKRKVHLSNLVLNGEMSREDALAKLEHIPYDSESQYREDTEYFLKKMGWSEQDLEDYLQRPPVRHDVYGSEIWVWSLLRRVHKIFWSAL